MEENLVDARGIEVGHIFKFELNTLKTFKSISLDDKGESKVMIMGCYGIRICKETLASAIEQNNDEFEDYMAMSISSICS